MHYIISDLHGTYDKFIGILEQIKFNKECDKLYIIGDIVDRGLQIDKCVKWVTNNLDNKSVFMTLGNHDYGWVNVIDTICMDLGLDINNIEDYLELKRHCNNLKGAKELSIQEILSFYRVVKTLPLYKILGIADKSFILVHAGINIDDITKTDRNTATWAREEFYNDAGINGYTIVFGHTPVQLMEDIGKYYSKNPEEPASIRYRKDDSMIAIDCGAVFESGRLACLRLEDMQEFYG